MSDQLTILVVDDEEKISEIVASYLEQAGYRAVVAHTGAEAFAALRRYTVSMVLLDLMLPDMTGEQICTQIRASSDMPIIMMTAKIDEESIIAGLNLGADDYITKPFSPRQLVARVNAVLRRAPEATGASSIVHRGEISVDTANRRASLRGQALDLTVSEYKILALLMERPHKIFTRDEILNHIKNDRYEVYDRTIDSHIKNLRQKIERDPKVPEYIKTVYGMGYRFGVTE